MNESSLIIQNISSLWPVVLSLIFVLVWLVRLEAKVLQLDGQLKIEIENKKELEEQIWEKLDEIQKSVQGISKSLARLEGIQEGKNGHV